MLGKIQKGKFHKLERQLVIYLGFIIRIFIFFEVSFSEQKFVLKNDYIHSIVLFQQHTHTNDKARKRQVIIWKTSALFVVLFK